MIIQDLTTGITLPLDMQDDLAEYDKVKMQEQSGFARIVLCDAKEDVWNEQ